MSNNYKYELDGSYYRNPLYGSLNIETNNKEPLLNDLEWMWREKLLNATQEETLKIWDMLLNPDKYGLIKRKPTADETYETRRMLCKIDRVYLSQVIIGDNPESQWHDILQNKWLYERCRETERYPDGHIDLWARGHFKSSIAIKLAIIQEHLINPRLTVCLISYEKSFAEETLKYIKGVYEENEDLKYLFPEVFYQKPDTQARSGQWTSKGIWLPQNQENSFASLTVCSIAKLKTGHHFDKLFYDDIVVRENATKLLMVRMRQQFTNSKSMMQKGPDSIKRLSLVGTRYHKDDTYQWLIDHKIVIPRVHEATHNKKLDGNPVYLSKDEWEDIKKGDPYQVACDYLLNPISSATAVFDVRLIKKFENTRPLDVFILVDPADSKGEHSDRTCMIVVGVDQSFNQYILDGIIDKLDIGERWTALKTLHKKWDAYCDDYGTDVRVYYEKFGMNSDIGAMGNFMRTEDYEFDINPVSFGTLGKATKEMRIRRIVGDINRGKVYFPKFVRRVINGITQDFEWDAIDTEEGHKVVYTLVNLNDKFPSLSKHIDDYSIDRPVLKHQLPISNIDYQHNEYDFIIEMLPELIDFPYAKHDDAPDAWSRYYDVPNLADLVGSNTMELIKPNFRY